MANFEIVSAVLPELPIKGFYFSGAHVFREMNNVHVNLEPSPQE
jgi:hypothetical protein